MMSRGSKRWGLSEQVMEDRLLAGLQKGYNNRTELEEREFVSILVSH